MDDTGTDQTTGGSPLTGYTSFMPTPPSGDIPVQGFAQTADILGVPGVQTSMTDFGMSPAQQVMLKNAYGEQAPPQAVYGTILQAQQDAAQQAQAAAGARAAGAAAENKLYADFLAQPRPDVYKPQYKALPKAPTPQYRNPLEAVGNPLAGLALVAGLFTRTPATATLNSAAAAMQAQREGDQLGYENAHKEFRDNLDLTMKHNEQERQAYLDSWNDRNKTMQERLADLQMKATMYKNNAVAAAARSGNPSEAQMALDAMGKFQTYMQNYAPIAKNQNQWEVQQIQQLQADIQKANPTWTQDQVLEATVKRAQALGLMAPPAGATSTKTAIPGSKSAIIQANADQILANGEAKTMADALQMATERYAEANRPLTTKELDTQAEMEVLRTKPENAGKSDEQLRVMARENLQRGTKSTLSERDYNRLQLVAQTTENALDKTDKLIDLLNRGEKAGLLGKGYRLAEVAGNIFGSNSTESAQVQEAIQYLRQTYGTIMQTGSQRLKAEAARIDYIIKGLEAGSTTVNTLQSIKDYQDMLIEALKLNQQQRLRSRPDVPTELPKGAAPAGAGKPASDFSAFPEAR